MKSQPEPMDIFHQLVAEERYREARGVLETESVDPQVAEKWLQWLDELQHEDRVLMGVASDKTKQDASRSLRQLGQYTGGVLAGTLMVLPAWALVIFIFDSFNVVLAGLFLFVGLVFSFLGWRRLLTMLIPENAMLASALLSGGLLAFMLTSRLPLWFYYDPPIQYVVAGLAMIVPYMAYLGWLVGGWIGSKVAELFAPRVMGE
jgi:hypothetical protein